LSSSVVFIFLLFFSLSLSLITETKKQYESELTTLQHILQRQQRRFTLERETFESFKQKYEKEKETLLQQIEHLHCTHHEIALEKERIRRDFENLSFEIEQWKSQNNSEFGFNDPTEKKSNRPVNSNKSNQNKVTPSTNFQIKKEEYSLSTAIKTEVPFYFLCVCVCLFVCVLYSLKILTLFFSF
jgi:DNA gyrase/topoisomerase IV subunit A